MAKEATLNDLLPFMDEEQQKLEAKQKLSGTDWQPQGGYHGSGIVPEDIWKRDFSPNSKEDTDLRTDTGIVDNLLKEVNNG